MGTPCLGPGRGPSGVGQGLVISGPLARCRDAAPQLRLPLPGERAIPVLFALSSPGQLENANLKEEGALAGALWDGGGTIWGICSLPPAHPSLSVSPPQVDPNSPPTPVEPPRCQPRPDAPSRAGWPGREPRSEADGQQGAPLAQGVAQHCQVPRLAPGQGAERQRLGRARGPARPRGPGAAGRGGDAEGRPGGTGRPVAGNAGGLVPRTAPGAGAAERGEEETPEAAGADECRDKAHCGEVGTLCHNVACVEERMAYSTHERARDVWGLPHAPCPMEVLDAFHTCLSQLEAQQQAAQLEKQDRSGAPQCHLHGQLVNLAVATILLVCISAAWACGLPLLRSRRRALSTLGVLALLSLAGHCWEGTCW
ncbi:unnamed protein product [Lepidochelys kempii]